nr:Chain I, Beta-PIX [synthetic construct]3QJN_J Chain J, Beta-PIX [synthetic construct]3QJN_K Chain K, Beta-PIX [synthetic construct]3QJN_L Chain L, Beta-PIX [synthetic construct]3QJN_M Chain M, Beta-PIX [synthetic construct]3QJN_N Chain N, Beta-PIX [synthetic construct]3QJN_O Chain O, Beta-PIX [synthetic construct]3QJN_P Chain P, Beta-PIX [synthetic construct]
AWDETNL